MRSSGVLRDNSGRTWLRFADGIIREDTILADFEFLDIPTPAVELFKFYEEIVNTQQFSVLPEIEEKVGAFGLQVIRDGEDTPYSIDDVQIAGGKISFVANRMSA